MKQNYLKQLFTALLLLCTTATTAYAFKVDGIHYKVTNSTTKEVEVFNNYDTSGIYGGDIVIPETVIFNNVTYTVTSIGESAFSRCTGLTSVAIPNSVTSIGGAAFYECSGLTSVEIPNSVTSIGSSAFSRCSGLTSVVIPNSVTSIGSDAFAYCSGLTNIEIPGSVSSIGMNAFRNCSKLENVIICNGVTSIVDSMFWECIGLTNVTIPNSVTSIDAYAFANCKNLENIEVPNSVKKIGHGAFQLCKLKTFTIPSSVTSIGEYVFSSCDGLKSITSLIPAEKLFAVSSKAFFTAKDVCTLYVPYGAKETYASTAGWNEFTNIVELEPEVIGGSCGANVNWILENGVLTITGNGTMNDYTWGTPALWMEYAALITNVVIEDGVTSIGDAAFYKCTGLTSIVIPNSVTSIGYEAFYKCTGLTSIVIPNSVTSIDDYTFCSCTGLTSVEIPNSVTSIGGYAFGYCSGLTSVEIPNSVTSIGNSAFARCDGLTSITIPNSVTRIWNNAFYGCTGLTSVTIPNSVTSIGSDTFNGCTGLTSVEIPNSVKSIGGFAFKGCTRLTSVEIPNSVTSIGEEAFRDCTGLTSITSLIPADNLFAPGNYAFSGVDKNACTLYVPYGAKETYAATAGWNKFANIVELEPTEVTVTINQYGCATYCSPYALDFTQVVGLKAYAATGYKSNSQVVTLTRVQTSEPGIGLFLKGEPGEYVVPVIESTDEHSLNMLVGTLEPTIVNSTDGAMSNYKFTIAEGDASPMFYPFEDNTTLSAGKAYLQIPTAWLPTAAQKSLSIRFDDGETTDIDEVKGENAKTIYDLQGRVVENPTSGIYIIDGKKVIIK